MMKRIMLSVLLLLSTSCYAFAANETIEALIGALEGKSPETIAREQEQKRGVEWANKEIEAVKKNLIFRTDKIENVTWVEPKMPYISPYFNAYCGERNGRIWMRLRLEPSTDTQPMVMQQVVINIDGEARRFSIDDKDRNLTSEIRSYRGTFGGVDVNRWYKERIDMAVTPELEKLLWQATGKYEALVRFQGRYNQDFKPAKHWHYAFDSILRYYRARQVLLGII